MFKKIFRKFIESIMTLSLLTLSGAVVFMLLLAFIEDTLGINTGLANPTTGTVFLQTFGISFATLLPSLFATIIINKREAKREIRKMGEALAESHSAADLLELYTKAKEREELLMLRESNIYLLKKAALRAWKRNKNAFITFETDTLQVIGDNGISVSAKSVDVITEAICDKTGLSTIPAAAFTDIYHTVYDSLSANNREELMRLWEEIHYLEYAISIRGTALPEIGGIETVEMRHDATTSDFEFYEITPVAPQDTDSEPDLLLQTE